MPRDYFQFKKFLIKQDRCGMKVCTDSCILGAYVPAQSAQRILDIGLGTGLLTLMIAQRTDATIDGVEIHGEAFAQAQENVQASPWSNRIQLYHQSVQDFASAQVVSSYDLIISNPPFFEKHPKSLKSDLNQAMHNDLLPFGDLAQAVDHLLCSGGRFVLMLPPYPMQLFREKTKAYAWQEKHCLFIFNRPQDKVPFRLIATFQKEDISSFSTQESILFIRDESQQYSPTFQKLLADYYLIF